MQDSKSKAKKADHKVSYRKPVQSKSKQNTKATAKDKKLLPKSNKQRLAHAIEGLLSGRFLIGVAAVACVIVATVMLIPVFGDYYVTKRANDQLQAEYQAIQDRNAKIQNQIDSLETPEGIEDRAREEFGWVREGEHAVNITGLQTSDSSTVLPAAVASGSVAPQDSLLTKALDVIFGVQKPVEGQSQLDSQES